MALEVPQGKGMPFGIKLFRVSMVFILMDGTSIFRLDSQIDSSKKSLHMYSNFFFFVNTRFVVGDGSKLQLLKDL